MGARTVTFQSTATRPLCSSAVDLRAEPRRARRGGPRLLFYFGCSAALHATLIGLVSLRSCNSDRRAFAALKETVDVELAAPLPPRQPRTLRPGGGVPEARPPASHRAARVRIAKAPEPPRDPTPPPAEAAPDEAPPVAAAPVDAVAAPSHRDPPESQVDATPRAAGSSGSGPGSHGGPGGRGAGAGGEAPTVARAFAFGRASPGPFRGVACFILPGVLRIADVHGCAPVAVFYTDVFDVSERQQAEGFPGISDRSTWFMIEYQGAFTVGQDGTYAFRLHSDDGSYLFIDGTLVIENDGKHKPESRSGSIALRSGPHQLRLLYAQTTDRMALQLFVRTPGARGERLFAPHI